VRVTSAALGVYVRIPDSRIPNEGRRTERAAAAAGTDLVLFTSLGDASRAQGALARGLADGSLDRAEFETSVSRVLALRSAPGG
jgi:hypothetical protein